MSKLFSLEGKFALVTGSTQGIGYAIAKGLAEAGASVILNGRMKDKLDEAVHRLSSDGLKVHGVSFDVTDEQGVIEAINYIHSTIAPIDILVNNAGITVRKKVYDLSYEEWKSVLAVNLDGAFLVTRAVVPSMIERKSGKILNTCSLMSLVARTDNTPYASSKGGMALFTKALAVELGPHNIQANGIGPGYFNTPLTKVLQQNEKFDTWVKSSTPAARWGEVEELVGTSVFLTSGASNFVTGQIVYVDGGFTSSL